MRHTISVLVKNKFGVLARVAGLFSGRGFNIESLTVGPTHDESLSRMTIVTNGDDDVLEQIDKQLNRLIEVIKVTDLTQKGFASRELLLLKVSINAETRGDVVQIANMFKADIIHAEPEVIITEVTGNVDTLDSFISMMEPYGIVELARTGLAALACSAKPTELTD